MVLAATLRVHCQYGPCRRGGSARQAQLRWPQRVRLSVIEPGSTMPDQAMAASSAAIFWASAWWLAATRTVSGIGPASWSCLTVYIQYDSVGRDLGRAGRRGRLHRRLAAVVGDAAGRVVCPGSCRG